MYEIVNNQIDKEYAIIRQHELEYTRYKIQFNLIEPKSIAFSKTSYFTNLSGKTWLNKRIHIILKTIKSKKNR